MLCSQASKLVAVAVPDESALAKLAREMPAGYTWLLCLRTRPVHRLQPSQWTLTRYADS